MSIEAKDQFAQHPLFCLLYHSLFFDNRAAANGNSYILFVRVSLQICSAISLFDLLKPGKEKSLPPSVRLHDLETGVAPKNKSVIPSVNWFATFLNRINCS